MGANMSRIPCEMLSSVMRLQPQEQQVEEDQVYNDCPDTHACMVVAQTGQAPMGANMSMIPSEMLTPVMQLEPHTLQVEQDQRQVKRPQRCSIKVQENL